MSKELIVFTNHGQTYHFNNVTNFRPTTTGFSFKYHGKATGVDRDAMFNNTSAAGYAIADTPEETTTLPEHEQGLYIEAIKPLPIETTKRGHQLFEQANKATQGLSSAFSKDNTTELLKQAKDLVEGINSVIKEDKIRDELKAADVVREQIKRGDIKPVRTAIGTSVGYIKANGNLLTGEEHYLLNKYFRFGI
ncbi:hypothetical protein LNP18_08580 [Leuconostoc citreum]|uniref:hypothetical protein n=1 Tax=Leuconostoc citreum TaxID=33964 RepID=UPI00200A20C4|nr:hypothetical protein [Leuconostoc citreum]MCK8606157.1 hypothetical protein [Leuconostoc citreum]